LEHRRDAAVVTEGSQVPSEHLTAQCDRARREWQETCQCLEKCTLAGSIRTIDANDFACAHSEIGRLERETSIAVNANS